MCGDRQVVWVALLCLSRRVPSRTVECCQHWTHTLCRFHTLRIGMTVEILQIRFPSTALKCTVCETVPIPVINLVRGARVRLLCGHGHWARGLFVNRQRVPALS